MGASPRTTSIDPAETSSSATDASTKSSEIRTKAALARSSATDSTSSPTAMAARTSNAPTDLAPADEPFASAISSLPEPSPYTRASGTRTSTPSRAISIVKPPASDEKETTQSSSAAVTRPPSPSTLLDEQISAAMDQQPSHLASAKNFVGKLDKQQTFIAPCIFLTNYQV